MKILVAIMLSALVLAGCGGDDGENDNELPTQVELSTQTDLTGTPEISTTLSNGLTATADIPPFLQTQMSASPAPTTAATDTPDQPSQTPVPTIRPTLTRTPDETRMFELNSTQDALKTPRFSTLTPVPTDAVDLIIIPTLPVIAADVVITESEFQQTLNQRVATSQGIASAQVNFVPGDFPGMRLRVQASGGQAMVTGDVFIAFQLSEGLVAITVTEISVGAGGTPPQGFVDVVQDELFTLVVESFDTILNERLGEQHDLENLTFTDTTMEIMLLVPAQ